MSPTQIRALREELACSAHELATAIGVSQQEVFAWERGETFPTKRLVTKMEELRSRGPAAVPRRPRAKRATTPSPMQLLASPELWSLFRKLLAHRELREATLGLAQTYPDPTDASEPSPGADGS